MDKFSELEAFVTVIEAGSFNAAGERLGVAKSIISRRVSQLENRLACRLLNRTTRRQSLTDEGQQFYQRAVQILADLDDAEFSLSEGIEQVRGKIRLAAPLSFGIKHLSQAISDFLELHPAIEMDIDYNDRTINLVEDGFDMAVRIGQLDDSSLVARRIGLSNAVTCASSAYLEKHGTPETPEQLHEHIALQYSNVSYRQQWTFQSNDNRKQLIHAQPQIRLKANNGEALALAAVQGLGLTRSPTFILGDYLRQEQLIPVLTEYATPAIGIYALYPPGRLIPQRVRAFSDFLAERFGDQPFWDNGINL